MPDAPDPTVRPLDHLPLQGRTDAPALVLKAGAMTYAELDARVGQLAAWLRARVSGKGERIATWAGKGELTCLMPLAAVRAGLVHVPINPLLKRAQVAHILGDSGAALLVANAARLASLDSGDASAAELHEEVKVLSEISHLEPLPPSQSEEYALAAILYTSGSTGRPKGVMLSNANLWLGAASVAHYLKLTPADRVLAVLPFAFDYGQNQLLSTWYAGGSVIPLDYLMPRDVLKAVDRHDVTTIAAVPPLWLQLVELQWPSEVAGKLKRLTNSGGALTPSLVRKLRTTFPLADLYPMYGLTEAFRSTYLEPALVDTHPTSMGRAIPFAEVLVVREDVGRHNAVDKVIGWAVQRGLLPLHEAVLQVSARASFELVSKAAMAGIPVLSAVSAPSALAVTHGRERGVTVVGFNRKGRCNVYTHPERITGE